ncbi:MAG: DNA-formamidopyrimidine glycosylase family protein, partial [Rhodoglobus sp.]|nr:DNA-formamidopyrimidine glycosylase family protein [Rhodoglobus sp.]
MPELPEVTALAADLGARLAGHTVRRLEMVSFSALKTFDPPVESLAGQPIHGVGRHGKFLDITIGDLHLVINLALAGWIRWRDTEAPRSKRPGRGPLSARLVLDDGSGFDVTEWGTKKSVALWVVRSPNDVPRIAGLGPDPLAAGFTIEHFRSILSAAGRAQIKGVLRNQSLIAGIGNAYSDEILHAARMSPFKPSDMPAEDSGQLFLAMRQTLADAIARADGVAASELKAEKKSGLKVPGR